MMNDVEKKWRYEQIKNWFIKNSNDKYIESEIDIKVKEFIETGEKLVAEKEKINNIKYDKK